MLHVVNTLNYIITFYILFNTTKDTIELYTIWSSHLIALFLRAFLENN